jgi:hypothetical protein
MKKGGLLAALLIPLPCPEERLGRRGYRPRRL